MSADNYYFLTKRGDKWVGIMRFASDDEPDAATGRADFECDSLDKAIFLAQQEYTEYGVVVDERYLEVPS